MNDNDLQSLAAAKLRELRAEARQAHLARLARRRPAPALAGDARPSHPRLDRLVGRARTLVVPWQRSHRLGASRRTTAASGGPTPSAC